MRKAWRALGRSTRARTARRIPPSRRSILMPAGGSLYQPSPTVPDNPYRASVGDNSGAEQPSTQPPTSPYAEAGQSAGAAGDAGAAATPDAGATSNAGGGVAGDEGAAVVDPVEAYAQKFKNQQKGLRSTQPAEPKTLKPPPTTGPAADLATSPYSQPATSPYSAPAHQPRRHHSNPHLPNRNRLPRRPRRLLLRVRRWERETHWVPIPPAATGSVRRRTNSPERCPRRRFPASRPCCPQHRRPASGSSKGPQQPAITIEKISPAEIQVGKPATFELIVRNVGQVPAQNVVVTDHVPAGTQLADAKPPPAAWRRRLARLATGNDAARR